MPRKPLWSEPIYDKKAEDEIINKSTGNVRVNLSIPQGLYYMLSEYTEENCLPSIPSACVQLIRLQLRARNEQKEAINVLKNLPEKEWEKWTKEDVEAFKKALSAPDIQEK